MIVLTPAERRAGLLLVLLLALGAASDLLGGRGVARGPRPRAAADTSASAVRGADGPASTPADSTPGTVARTFDLNRASANELDDLPGVGPVPAARILEHRRRF